LSYSTSISHTTEAWNACLQEPALCADHQFLHNRLSDLLESTRYVVREKIMLDHRKCCRFFSAAFLCTNIAQQAPRAAAYRATVITTFITEKAEPTLLLERMSIRHYYRLTTHQGRRAYIFFRIRCQQEPSSRAEPSQDTLATRFHRFINIFGTIILNWEYLQSPRKRHLAKICSYFSFQHYAPKAGASVA
jgi:hypothetical protein